MALSDELAKLQELRQSGALSDEEFARAKTRLLDGQAASPSQPPPALTAFNALRRSRTDRWIGGVCGGIARVTSVESWVWRLLFALLLLFGGAGALAYLLLWVFVPNE